MNASVLWLQIGLLTAEVVTTAFLFVVVFRARRVLGLVPLYVVVGTFQFVQTPLLLSVYVPFSEAIQISPGSAVMLPATIFAVLLVYIAEDAPAARRLTYGVVIANVALSLLAVFFDQQLAEGGPGGLVDLPPAFFRSQPRILLVSTAAMFMDVVLVIVLYEAISARIRSIYLRLFLSTTVVLWLDTVVFVTGAFFGQPEVPTVMLSAILGKTATAAVYAAAFAAFVLKPGLHLAPSAEQQDVADFFRPLTYRQRYEQAREMALRDPLTGLYNRRYFQDALERESDSALRYSSPLALLLIDVDHFKPVNDRYGHQEGDRALKLVGASIARTVRGADIACRVGGEEFAVIAPRADEEIAELLGERVRASLRQDFRAVDPPFAMDRLTVTIGVAAISGQESEPVKSIPDRIFGIADRRLYLGKKTGRDRVVGWRAEAEPPTLPTAES